MTPTLNLPCQITRVHDGDTLSVRISINANVRLKDCWAPELSEPGGTEAREQLKRWANGEQAVLSIPLSEATNLGDLFSFGRVIGDVHVVNQIAPLAKLMVEQKLASTKRGGKLGE